jgi:hypothetical protein
MPKGQVSGPSNPLPEVGSEWKILRVHNQPIIVIESVKYDDHRKEHRVQYRFKVDRGFGQRKHASCWYESGFRRPSCYGPVAAQQAKEVAPAVDVPPERQIVEIDTSKLENSIARLCGDAAWVEKAVSGLVRSSERQEAILMELRASLGRQEKLFAEMNAALGRLERAWQGNSA